MSKNKLTQLTQIAVMTALAVILDKLVIYQLPQGGGISLAMLPLLLISFRNGIKAGLLTGFLTGLIQLFFGGYFLNVFQVICDYLLAYAAVGLAGFVPVLATSPKERMIRLAFGSVIGGLGRLFFHTLSGIIFYGDFAPDNMPVWQYALTYNASYMVPSTLLALLILILLYSHKSGKLLTKNTTK